MKRAYDSNHPEWMDLPQEKSVLQEDLKNLETINRWFGGREAYLTLIQRFLKKERVTRILDLATGAGDHPRNVATWAAKNRFQVQITAVDFQPQTLEFARSATPPELPIQFEAGDIRGLTYASQSFDVVICSLALHHFSEPDAVRILREMKRVSREGGIVIDLERSRAAYLAVWALTELWLRAPMTKHDARLSVKRAFSNEEFQGLAQEAGWSGAEFLRLPWFRQTMVLKLN